MPVEVTAYKCQWCNMTSMTKGSVVRHEKNSCKNHKSCQLCRHYEEDWEDDGSGVMAHRAMWCHAIDNELYAKQTNCDSFAAKTPVDETTGQ